MSHDRVATILLPDSAAIAQALAGLNGVELVEVRLDAMWRDVPDPDQAAADLDAILDSASVPLLATLRPQRQGGAWVGDEVARINLLMAAAQAGFAAVDIENDHQEVAAVTAALRDHADIVASDHRFIEAPSREVGLRHLQSHMDLRGRYDKIAFPCGSIADVLRSLELAHSHAHRHGRPAIAPIGGDALVRALLPLAGNHATYGAATGSPPAIPGQPTLADVQAVWDHWGLRNDDLPGDANAGWLAVLGDPVEHSDSPRIHNAALRAGGRAERFGALRVPNSLPIMRLLVTVAGRIGLRGGSITMPLKEHACKVTNADEVARAVGAVNCFRTTAAGADGTNTDATALRRLLDGSRRVAILGAGGAARAAIWAAQQVGAEPVFCSRDPERAQVVRGDTGATWVPWADRASITADAWVQATPLGAGEPCPLAAIAGDRFIELVYKGGETPLQVLARDAGLHVTSGDAFLIEQAVDAYRFWTGQEPDRAAMEAA